MINVLLADKQRLYREGIERLLKAANDIRVRSIVRDDEEEMKEISKREPDILLFNVYLSPMDSLPLVQRVKHEYPDVKVILMTSFEDKAFVIKSIQAGVNAFLYTNVDGNTLINTIRDVHEGKYVISGEAAKILAEEIVAGNLNVEKRIGQKLTNQNILLTPREIDVAMLLMKNATNKEIAKQLYLSEGTVKNYVSDLYIKLDIHNRKRLSAYLRELIVEK